MLSRFQSALSTNNIQMTAGSSFGVNGLNGQKWLNNTLKFDIFRKNTKKTFYVFLATFPYFRSLTKLYIQSNSQILPSCIKLATCVQWLQPVVQRPAQELAVSPNLDLCFLDHKSLLKRYMTRSAGCSQWVRVV